MTLAEFLLARFDVAEENALRGCLHAEAPPDFDPGWDTSTVADLPPIVAHFVLADLQAKCRIVIPQLGDQWEQVAANDPTAHQAVLAILARPYADHPDYRDEWRP
ncbi:DUF6221 family protein [Actinopolymorpha pittospori]